MKIQTNIAANPQNKHPASLHRPYHSTHPIHYPDLQKIDHDHQVRSLSTIHPTLRGSMLKVYTDIIRERGGGSSPSRHGLRM